MKKILSVILLTGLICNGYAQRILSLYSCRTLALANNKELRIAKEKINAAHYQQKAAFTNYLPKIDLMGTYMRTQKEISLLVMIRNKVSEYRKFYRSSTSAAVQTTCSYQSRTSCFP